MTVVDIVYANSKFPTGWESALKVGQFRFVRFHCGFGSDPDYVLKLEKHETIDSISYIPAGLTNDVYLVYLKRGDYVKAEARLFKFGLENDSIPKNVTTVPIYIQTTKSSTKLRAKTVMDNITALVEQHKFQETLDYMKGFPITPDILHYTRKCLNLLNRRTEVITVNLDSKLGLRSWYHCDALGQAKFELSVAHFYLKNEGGKSAYKLQDTLVTDRTLLKFLRNSYLRNICGFYSDQMMLRLAKPVVKTYLQLDHHHDYHVMNMSLITINDQLPDWCLKPAGCRILVLVRTVNYLIKNGLKLMVLTNNLATK